MDQIFYMFSIKECEELCVQCFRELLAWFALWKGQESRIQRYRAIESPPSESPTCELAGAGKGRETQIKKRGLQSQLLQFVPRLCYFLPVGL